MLVDILTNPFIQLLIVLLACGALVIYVTKTLQPHAPNVADSPMARTIATLQNENTKLQAEVKRLEIAFDRVLQDNAKLRSEVEELRKQLDEFDWIIQHNKQVAENWRSEALRDRQAKEK